MSGAIQDKKISTTTPAASQAPQSAQPAAQADKPGVVIAMQSGKTDGAVSFERSGGTTAAPATASKADTSAATTSRPTTSESKAERASAGELAKKALFFIPGLLYVGFTEAVKWTFNTALPWVGGKVWKGLKFAGRVLGKVIDAYEYIKENFLKWTKPIREAIKRGVEWFIDKAVVPFIEHVVAPVAKRVYKYGIKPAWKYIAAPVLKKVGQGLRFTFVTAPVWVGKTILKPVYDVVEPIVGPTVRAIGSGIAAGARAVGEAAASVRKMFGR